MNLPFTVEQFLQVFALYNVSVWPSQVFLIFFGLTAIFFTIHPLKFSDRAISFLLAVLWLWMGIVYHINFFADINPVAYGFGAIFIVQVALFLWMAVQGKISYQFLLGWREAIGMGFAIYGLFIYHVVGIFYGHLYPSTPTFGTPCPTTIFTFGILLMATGVPRYLLIIPGLWSVIGFMAALQLGIREDFGLLVAGVVGTAILLIAKPRGVSPTAS
ncbi:MAG: hypothetical protein HGB19_08270 [Chlorobiales bacterium]|jgi:hypothetical protein|nr:hypothetical protein [Chlorobiales bacterium]